MVTVKVPMLAVSRQPGNGIVQPERRVIAIAFGICGVGITQCVWIELHGTGQSRGTIERRDVQVEH